MSNSLATKLQDDEFVVELKAKDPGAFFMLHFVMYGDEVKPDLECQATYCSMEGKGLPRKAGKGELQKLLVEVGVVRDMPYKSHFVFCYACNRLAHTKCNKVDVQGPLDVEMERPFLCNRCVADPENEDAIAFGKRPEAEHLVYRRANAFRKESRHTIVLDRAGLNSEQRRVLAALERQLQKTDLERSFAEMTKAFTTNTGSSTPRRSQRRLTAVQELTSSSSDSDEDIVPRTVTVRNREKRKSYIDGIDVQTIDTSAKILLEQAEVQREAAREAAAAKILVTLRKALKPITKFDGNPANWIEFVDGVDRYKFDGQYEDNVLKQFVFAALEGEAHDIIFPILNTSTIDEVMEKLERNFGKAAPLIADAKRNVLTLTFSDPFTRKEARKALTAIDAYHRTCKYVKKKPVESVVIARELLRKMSGTQRLHFKERFPTEDATLKQLAQHFENLYPILDATEEFFTDSGRASHRQLHSLATTTVFDPSANAANRFDMFAVRGRGNRNFGYDMDAVRQITRRCEFCRSTEHFSVECNQYRRTVAADRFTAVQAKNLCRCCLLVTDHFARDCQLRNGCGFLRGGEECGRSHHITLHNCYANLNPYNTRNSNNQRGDRNQRRYNNNQNHNNRNQHQNNHNNRNNNNNNQHNNNERANTSNGTEQNDAMNANEVEAVTPISTTPSTSTSSATNAENEANNVRLNSPKIEAMKQLLEKAQRGASVVGAVNWTNVADETLRKRENPALVMPISLSECARTVKVFKTVFLGENLKEEGYAVGDSGAEISLMKESLRTKLGLNGETRVLSTTFANGSVATVTARKVSLRLRGVQKGAQTVVLHNVYAIPDLKLPPRSLDVEQMKKKYPHLRSLPFESYKNAVPAVLIGSPHAAVFESTGKLYTAGIGKPVGLKAQLGYSIYGGTDEIVDNPEALAITCKEILEDDEVFANERLEELMCYNNSIDNLGIRDRKTQYTEDELSALAIINEQMRVRENGIVEVPLVWNRVDGQIPRLQNNRSMVFRRQEAHEAKLRKNPKHLEEFDKNFKDLLDKGYVREATPEDLITKGNLYYLPMSLVINANKDPPKFRNVFDASAKYQGNSLNSYLLKGPDLLVNQLGPLLRMRTDNIAFTGDVENMFMRIKINDRDSLCQCVLWRNPNDGQMRTYVVTSMLFGPSCSPFASQFVKNAAARQWADCWPDAASVVEHATYMDDAAAAAKNLNEAVQLAAQTILIFNSIDMKLRNLQSNCKEFLQQFPPEYVSSEAIQMLENENQPYVTKILGCSWNCNADCYEYKFDRNLYLQLVKDTNHRPTKRDQCSTLARIYDIFGFLTPLTIRGKIILQQSWLKGINWDEEIDDDNYAKWKSWVMEIANAAKIKISRQYFQGANLTNANSIELHLFADAGGEAFSAVSYFVLEVDGKRRSMIVLARARVTPIRLRTKTRVCEMPRLELYACLIAARLAHTIITLMPKLNFKKFFWTDSLVALRWIKNANHKLVKYATAPIEEILENSEREEWNYVPTKLNVADLATKFAKMDFSDSEGIWFKGPEFLTEQPIAWPKQNKIQPEDQQRSDEYEAAANRTMLTMSINAQKIFDENKYVTAKLPPMESFACKDPILSLSPAIQSRYEKLLRATARGLKLYMDAYLPFTLKRIICNSRKSVREKEKLLKELDLNKIPTKVDAKQIEQWKVDLQMNELSANDLIRAQHFLIRREQVTHYAEDYRRLQKKAPPKDEQLSQLNVWLDHEGLIRINSRVQLGAKVPNSFLPLLPRRSMLSTLLLEHIHYEYRHVHLETQIAHARTIAWIPQLRAAVQTVKFHCNFCRVKHAIPKEPLMSALPRQRVDASIPPFHYTSLDCFGPVQVRMYNKEKKVWIVLFACVRTRFIHLHLLEAMATENMLEAITIFWAAHGPVLQFWSDNGTNFVGAARKLKEERLETENALRNCAQRLKTKLAFQHCDWKFFPAYAPWMAGIHERLIAEVKRSVGDTLRDRKISRMSLNIALHAAAHRINNRPLTHNAIEAEDSPLLTPHILAKNRSGFPFLQAYPPELLKDVHLKDNKHYKMGQYFAHEITRRFNNHYLPVLARRTKWTRDCDSPIRVGDLVLMIEPNDTRQQWKRARVIKIHAGKDGRGRVADIIMPDGKVKKSRAIQRLAKLDLQPSLHTTLTSVEKKC